MQCDKEPVSQAFQASATGYGAWRLTGQRGRRSGGHRQVGPLPRESTCLGCSGSGPSHRASIVGSRAPSEKPRPARASHSGAGRRREVDRRGRRHSLGLQEDSSGLPEPIGAQATGRRRHRPNQDGHGPRTGQSGIGHATDGRARAPALRSKASAVKRSPSVSEVLGRQPRRLLARSAESTMCRMSPSRGEPWISRPS